MADTCLPALLEFEPFAAQLGIRPDVLKRDPECPALVTIGGVEFAVADALGDFEVAILLRGVAAEREARRVPRATAVA